MLRPFNCIDLMKIVGNSQFILVIANLSLGVVNLPLGIDYLSLENYQFIYGNDQFISGTIVY